MDPDDPDELLSPDEYPYETDNMSPEQRKMVALAIETRQEQDEREKQARLHRSWRSKEKEKLDKSGLINDVKTFIEDVRNNKFNNKEKKSMSSDLITSLRKIPQTIRPPVTAELLRELRDINRFAIRDERAAAVAAYERAGGYNPFHGGSKQKRRKKSRKSRRNTLKKKPRKTFRKTLKKRSKRSKRSTKRR